MKRVLILVTLLFLLSCKQGSSSNTTTDLLTLAGISAATSCAGSVTATTTTQTIPFVIKNIGFVITKPYVSSNVFFKNLTIGQAAVFTLRLQI